MNLEQNYLNAKDEYAQFGIDTDAAIKKALEIPISLHCWQADDNNRAIEAQFLSVMSIYCSIVLLFSSKYF